jgi:hypothetical protein
MTLMVAAVLVEVAVVMLSATASSATTDISSERPRIAESPAMVCVGVWSEARYVGFGYNHIVHVANGCNVPTSCTVTTNVNPEPQTVIIPAGSRTDVVTFVGSPASTFTAKVECVRAGAAAVLTAR